MNALAALALVCDLAAAHVSGPLVEARSVGHKRGKPPLDYQFFDVVLRNPANGPRWIILPDVFPYEGRNDPLPGGEVSELQRFELGGVHFVQAIGANLQAVKLPAHGIVTLRRLTIDSWWDKPHDSTEIEVMVARSIKIGGSPLEELGVGLSASGADVEIPRGVDHATFWHPKEHEHATVAFDVESRTRISVSLKP
jgi:hypothetical protein